MPEVTFAPSAEDFAPGEESQEFDAPAAQVADDGDDAPAESDEPAKHTEPEKLSAEEEARKFGWVPKDEFRGPAGKWRSAEDFLEINNQSAPVLKERLRKIEENYDAKFKRLETATQRALELQRQQLEADYQHRLAQAKADGDVDEVERLASNRPTVDTGPDPEAQAFVERNPWFLQNQNLHRIAVGIEEELAISNPSMSIGERLVETERQMASLYPAVVKPSKPANPRPAPPPVNEGVRLTPRKSAVDKLTREERSMGEMMVKQGAYKTLDEYAAALDEDVVVIGKKARA